MCQLQKQFDYYKRNKSRLIEDYPNQYLIISEQLEVTAFPTIAEAYTFGAKHYGLGNFMLQKCSDEADSIKRINNVGLRWA